MLLQNRIKLLRPILFAILFLLFDSPEQLKAQAEFQGAEFGFRYGSSPALSYRLWVKEQSGYELLFTKSGESLLFSGFWLMQRPLGFSGGYLHYGAGGSIGARNGRQQTALDGQLGLDYYLPVVPLNMSFDLRPWFVITGGVDFQAELALSARWVF